MISKELTRLKLLKFFQYRRLQVFDLSFEPFCLSDVHKWKFLFEKKFQNISKCTNGSTNAAQRCIQCYLSPFHPFFLANGLAPSFICLEKVVFEDK